MSFILDALKKSEAERQRKSMPGFADIPDASMRPSAPRWMWVVGGLLAINLAVLAVVLLRNGAEQRAAESITRAIETPGVAPQESFSDIVAEAKKNQRESEPPPSTEPESEEPVASQGRQPAAASTVTTSPRSFNELRADGTLQLPELHLDLHVYSDRSADRFVIVNMNKYSEGATLTEGPRVVEVTPQGVILEHRGTPFLLPRQ